MEITWLGHSSLRIRSADVTLVTDPYADSVGFSMPPQAASIVTVSNDHPNHSHLQALAGTPRVVMGPSECESGDIYLLGIGTRGPAREGQEGRHVNTVFIIKAEGRTLCHVGDLSQMLSPGQVEALGQTDVLFVPAGGICTLSPAQVVELVNLIGPRIVVPIHYRADGVTVELEPVDGFLKEMGVSEVAPQARLNVTLTNLPRERRVVVLQRAR